MDDKVTPKQVRMQDLIDTNKRLCDDLARKKEQIVEYREMIQHMANGEWSSNQEHLARTLLEKYR